MNGRQILQQGMSYEAFLFYKNCVARMKVVLGEGHKFTLTVCVFLTDAYSTSCRYTEADEMYRECKEKTKKTFGENHDTIGH